MLLPIRVAQHRHFVFERNKIGRFVSTHARANEITCGIMPHVRYGLVFISAAEEKQLVRRFGTYVLFNLSYL